MPGFNDTTLGSQLILVGNGFKAEFCTIDVSNDVSVSNTSIPTTITHNLAGWIGMWDGSLGCVTLQSRVVTDICLTSGKLDISIADLSAGVVTGNGKIRYVVWGW